MRILIVGAGIAGLTLAALLKLCERMQCLLRRGAWPARGSWVTDA